jgi:hypothetical protein
MPTGCSAASARRWTAWTQQQRSAWHRRCWRHCRSVSGVGQLVGPISLRVIFLLMLIHGGKAGHGCSLFHGVSFLAAACHWLRAQCVSAPLTLQCCAPCLLPVLPPAG